MLLSTAPTAAAAEEQTSQPPDRGSLTLPAPASDVAFVSLNASLVGGDVVPGPGDPDGTGFTGVVQEGDGLCYSVEVVDTDAPVTAGIYQGAAGNTGPRVIDLDIATNGLEACTPVDPTVTEPIFADPSGYYAQVTTAEFPNGALRGQLEPFTFRYGDLTFEPRQGPPGTDIAVTSVTPCRSDQVRVAFFGGGWYSIAWDVSDPDDFKVDFDASDLLFEQTVPVAPDGSWTAHFVAPTNVDQERGSFVAACYDAIARVLTLYNSFDSFRLQPVGVTTPATAVPVQPRFTG